MRLDKRTCTRKEFEAGIRWDTSWKHDNIDFLCWSITSYLFEGISEKTLEIDLVLFDRPSPNRLALHFAGFQSVLSDGHMYTVYIGFYYWVKPFFKDHNAIYLEIRY